MFTIKLTLTSCISARLCSCILVDPGRETKPPAPREFAWTRDIVRRFCTLLDSSAPDPFNWSSISLLVASTNVELIGKKSKGQKRTCLVIAANFSAKSASPFIKGNRKPLPSSASSILITFWDMKETSNQDTCRIKTMDKFHTRIIQTTKTVKHRSSSPYAWWKPDVGQVLSQVNFGPRDYKPERKLSTLKVNLISQLSITSIWCLSSFSYLWFMKFILQIFAAPKFYLNK